MREQSKFIITKSKAVADKLIANDVRILSDTNDLYVFINDLTSHFSFDASEFGEIAYTNILSL